MHHLKYQKDQCQILYNINVNNKKRLILNKKLKLENYNSVLAVKDQSGGENNSSEQARSYNFISNTNSLSMKGIKNGNNLYSNIIKDLYQLSYLESDQKKAKSYRLRFYEEI